MPGRMAQPRRQNFGRRSPDTRSSSASVRAAWARFGAPFRSARIATLRALAQAVASGAVDFDTEQPLARFVARCTAVRGIGDWTAHYMAMRALRDADAFPAGDIVLRKVLRPGVTLSTKELEHASQPWRPFRAYAVLLLWRAA